MLALADISTEILRRDGPADQPRQLLMREDKNGGGKFAFRVRESLRGGIARATWRAGLPNSWTVLGELGLKHRNRVLVSEDAAIDIGMLAEALAVSREEIARRRYEDAGKGGRTYFGLVVPIGSIETNRRRFAPTFLKDHNYHLASWELKFLPFCPVTWDLLISSCTLCRSGEGQSQGWTRTLTPVDRCDECGRKLSRVPTSQVPPPMRPALEVIARLVDPDSRTRQSVTAILPPALQKASAQAMLDVVLGLSRHMVTPSASVSDSQQLERLHKACDALRRWPQGLQSIQFSASLKGAALPALMQAYAALGSEPPGDEVIAELSGFAASTHRPSASIRRNRMILGMREAVAVAGLTDDVLRAIWSAGLVTRHYRAHGTRLLPAFDAAELRVLAAAWKARLSSASVAYRFGLPNYAIEQCAALGILRPTRLSVPESGPCFPQEAADKFSATLMSSGIEPQGETVALSDAMLWHSGGMKPWGRVLQAIKDGRLPAVLTEGSDRHLTKRLLVDRDIVSTLLKELQTEPAGIDPNISKWVTQGDALEILNCSATSTDVLVGLESRGTNPKLFELADVLALARSSIPIAEVARLLEMDAMRTFRVLRAARVREIVIRCWDRPHAMQLIAHTIAIRASQLELAI